MLFSYEYNGRILKLMSGEYVFIVVGTRWLYEFIANNILLSMLVRN